MLDLMNQFANTSSATEQDIAEVVKRVGALGQQAGFTVTTMVAMAKNLEAMKIQPEIAATGIKNMLLALTAGEAATKSQSEVFNKLGFDTKTLAEAMQKDAPNAIQKLLGSIKKLPKAEQLSTLNQLFGSQSITSVSSFNFEKFAEDLTLANDKTQSANAMAKEAGARWDSTAGQLQILKNRTNEVAINLGSALLPAINDTIAGVSPLITNFAEFAKENPEVVKNIVGTAGALVGLKMTTLAARYAVNGLHTVWTVGKGTALAFSFATKTQTYSLAAQKVVMMASVSATKASTAAQWAGRNAAYAFSLVTSKQTYSLAAQKVVMMASVSATKASTAAQWAGRNAAYAFSLVTSKQTYSLAAQKAAMLASSTATRASTAAQWLWNVALTANPIGIIIVGLGAAAAAMYALYQTCEPVRNAFDWVFTGIAGFVRTVWEKLQMLCGAAKSVAEWLGLIDEDAEVDVTENKTIETSAIPAGNAANAVAKPMPVFPASVASEEFINYSTNQQTIVQPAQISIPMNFDVQGLDEREFRRQMENARPDFEEIVKRVMEKVSHEKARISFAN